MAELDGKNILLVISGGISAYKSLELIRLLKKSGANPSCILTSGGARFITPLSVSSLSGNPVYTDLWSLKDESEMGHIRLGRENDLIVIAPASASFIARASLGIADDLASATLLASNRPTFFAPAMNPEMWIKQPVQENVSRLESRGFIRIGPNAGDSACGETGTGRMVEPEEILREITRFFLPGPLEGKRAIVTSGPTYEALDPVRFIGNRSSGKQGHAIASSLSKAGAEVTLISGPVSIPDPSGIKVIRVESAIQMHEAVMNSLPCDIAVCAAAVADWRPSEFSNSKIKKSNSKVAPAINLTENPDILASLSTHNQRPALVIGFAAETEDLVTEAQGKLERKKCDWIIANKINENASVFGSDKNHVYFITASYREEWPEAQKNSIAGFLTDKIKEHFGQL